jgi:hypothetical protein
MKHCTAQDRSGRGQEKARTFSEKWSSSKNELADCRDDK